MKCHLLEELKKVFLCSNFWKRRSCVYDWNESFTLAQLNLIYVLDTSGAMSGEPINQLNAAMVKALKVAEEVGIEMELGVRVRVIKFSSSAQWIIGSKDAGERPHDINWKPLKAEGNTNTAAAIDLAREVMHPQYLGTRNLKPVVILIASGCSSDPEATKQAVDRLKASLKSSTGLAKDKIIRIALAVTGADRAELEYFASIGNIEHKDGTIEENVPLVFDVDILSLKDCLKSVTRSSILSSLAYSADDADDVIVISNLVPRE